MLRQSTFFSGLKSNLNKAHDIVAVVVGAGIVAIVIRWLLEVLSRVHWVLGAILAGGFVIVALWLTHLVKRSSHSADPSGVLGVLALGLLTVVTACAWVSFTLHVTGTAAYSVPTTYSLGRFVDLYMYTFLDLLPGIEPLKTLTLKPPIEARNVTGGLPILAFKLFVVWLLFDAFLSWRKGRQEGAQTQSGQNAAA